MIIMVNGRKDYCYLEEEGAMKFLEWYRGAVWWHGLVLILYTGIIIWRIKNGEESVGWMIWDGLITYILVGNLVGGLERETEE